MWATKMIHSHNNMEQSNDVRVDDEELISLNIDNEYSTHEPRDDERPVEVRLSRPNVLNLFSSSNSQWSEYYNITMVTKENEERQKNATPLLTSQLKQKLQERRALRKSCGINSLSISEPAINVAEMPQSCTVIDTQLHEDTKPIDTFIQIREQTAQSSNSTEISDRVMTGIPWQTKNYYEETRNGIMLHEEIIDFYNFIKETPEEREQRELLIGRVTKICKSIDRDCTVSVFGSYPTNLMLPGSDLDLYVNSPGYYRNALGYLRNLGTAIRNNRLASKIEFVQAARVPLIKFVDKETGQHVDISCNIQGPAGDSAIEIIQDFSRQFPAFKYLTILLKYFLRQRALNEVFTGGLSSYGLSLMVISHLQMHISNVTEKDFSTTSLGTLLLDFFALYGIYFNYKRIGIDVTKGGSYVPINENDEDDRKNAAIGCTKLWTFDPNDLENNVTKQCWNMSAVRNAFRFAFSALTAYGEERREGSFLSSIIRVTQDLIERRVWIHGDEQYRSYCSRNFIPYGITDQKKKFNKMKSKDKKKWNKKRKRDHDDSSAEDSSDNSDKRMKQAKKRVKQMMNT